MAESVNPIFEIENPNGEQSFVTVDPDGRIDIEVCDGHYSGKLSLADSIGLAALVKIRSNPNNRICKCGHRLGVHYPGSKSCCGAEDPYHQRFEAPPADLPHCSCKAFEAKP